MDKDIWLYLCWSEVELPGIEPDTIYHRYALYLQKHIHAILNQALVGTPPTWENVGGCGWHPHGIRDVPPS